MKRFLLILLCLICLISLRAVLAGQDSQESPTIQSIPQLDSPTIQSILQPVPEEPNYSPPAYSPPASSYSDYSPAWNYSNNDVDVRGYYRKDGTYVKPYSRTKPDGIPYNNYGYPGNYNPNTGEISK